MKRTKKEMFVELLSIKEVVENVELKAFVEREIELLNRKRASTGLTAKQAENEKIKEEIIATLRTMGEPMKITEVVKSMNNDYTNQKISALMKQLVDNGEVVREMEKKTAKFRLA